MRNWKYINGAEVGNATIKFYGETIDLTKKSESDLKEILEELQMMHEGFDEQRAIKEELKKRQTGNAFDFETQAVVDRKEAVKTAEEELRKAEAERNKHRGERYWEEAYITAKKDVERAKENLARAQRNKAGNSRFGNSAYDDGVKRGKEDKRKGKLITAAGFDMHVPSFSKYSYQEKEEFKKGYYSSNDLTKEDIYKSWKTGNSIYSELNKGDKRVVIESDGSWYVYDKNGKIVEQGRESNSDNAFGKFKAKGYNSKACNQDGVARMFQGLVKDEDKDEKHYEGAIDNLEKVGNATFDMTDRDYENEYKSLVQKRNNVQKGTKEYEEIQKRLDEIRKKLGRSPFGNSSSDEEYWKKQYIEAARKKGVPENKIQEFIKKIEKEGAKGVLSPIKNSKSDDKFAYVMREFEEGKLKSSSGETVTDPEQAKAIAYSESKKAENGLARARKAIH